MAKKVKLSDVYALVQALNSKYGCPTDIFELMTMIDVCPENLHPAVVHYMNEYKDRELIIG